MKFSRKSLYFKLILSFIGVAFSATAIAAIFVRFTTTDSLAQFLVDQQRSSMVQSLINYYTLHGSWDGVEESWDDMQRQTIPTPNPPSPTREPVPAPNPLEEKPFVENSIATSSGWRIWRVISSFLLTRITWWVPIYRQKRSPKKR
jgi:hypothetical protein